ncbi:transferase, Chloramphenicol acetyltransferase-like domain protein [Artemisia annua]|uniref:Transferase, Chloramphenicol acetyltransferase-like domain protein n=1 Tax=Artemisia annua TaxID=35608 RepID=A0A2U1PI11_ARTAN|nr:transferase, Chloramphenicol acetyltransferase-like domain protein [Artemisia annua]
MDHLMRLLTVETGMGRRSKEFIFAEHVNNRFNNPISENINQQLQKEIGSEPPPVGNEDHIMSLSSTLCSAAVTGKFDEKIIEFILGTHQAATLLLFNASKKLSYCEIKAHLKLTYAVVVRLLQSIVEYMIVTKVQRSKIVSETDVFQFSLTFADMMRSIRYINIYNSNRRLENSVKDKNDTEIVDLHVISRERIKPLFATPHHLRNFKLSAIDQYMVGLYTCSAIFLPNTDNTCVSNVVKFRSRRLKESLSELLTLYYPFAGEINDNLHIECNDKGVYFIEARVNQTVYEFLCHPDDQKVRNTLA